MSKETLNWLNNNVLVGFADKRGKAWHYSEEHQGDQPNHYPMAVPAVDVRSRLFGWDVVELQADYPWINPDGSLGMKSSGMKHLVRSDTGDHLGTVGRGYEIHPYSEWLIEEVASLLDVSEGELGIGSAGLLMGGAVAWVQVERPENVVLGGDALRPFIVATTSLNGKFATSYRVGTTRVVCDNTLDSFHRERGTSFNARHTKNSKLKLAEARNVLDLSFKFQDEELAEFDRLMNKSVTDDQFWSIVNKLDPVPNEKGYGQTLANNKRLILNRLWNEDDMVAPYRGTAWGIVQAYNTYEHHHATLRARGTVRPERNLLNFLSGKTLKNDQRVLAAVTAV